MTRAWLSSHGVEFDALDVIANTVAAAELQARGIRGLPVVMAGDEVLVGWNPARLAALVGQVHEERVPLPDELIGSLRALLAATLAAVRQVPADAWETVAPVRPRPLRELARHIFEVVERGVDADVLGIFPATEWLPERDVPSMTGAARVARYGQAVRAKFVAWYSARHAAAFARTIDADVGPRTLTQVLDRTRHHAGQHLRQLYAMLELCGVTPSARLTDDDLRRLGLDQLPAEVF